MAKTKKKLKFKKQNKRNYQKVAKKNTKRTQKQRKNKFKNARSSRLNKLNQNDNFFTPESNDRTAVNHLVTLLPSIKFKKSKKKVPSNLKECVALDHPHRALLLQQFFRLMPTKYNRTFYQYACQLQR